jgi:hypothetical protein
MVTNVEADSSASVAEIFMVSFVLLELRCKIRAWTQVDIIRQHVVDTSRRRQRIMDEDFAQFQKCGLLT